MAPNHADPASSEEDAPESHTLVESKRTIQRQNDALATFRAAEKSKMRARNRERDRKLKERAQKAKGKGKEVGGVVAEAGVEGALHGVELGGDEGSDEDLEESAGDEEGSGEDEEDENEVGSEGDEEEELPALKTKLNPNHLPDHLFASAFASNASQLSATKRKPEDDHRLSGSSRKRRKNNRTGKDLIVGSRAIRTLSNDRALFGISTVPSRKVKNFIDRSLGFGSGALKAKGWERRAVNVGVLKGDGPAVGFVRNR